MNIPDLTQLILESSIWLLIGLSIYYLLSLAKVHLIWKIQSRIWNNAFEKNIFKGYYSHLLKSILTNYGLHKTTFKYLFKYKEKDFPIEDIEKTFSIKNRLRLLDSLTLFLKPFLFFALVFALIRCWISSKFFYDELHITLGEIQILLNKLNALPFLNTINKHKILIYILLGLILIFIPYFYTQKKLSKTIKRRVKLLIISLTILSNITFFGVLTSETTTDKTEKLSDLRFEISTVHNNIFKEVYITVVMNEIEEEIIKEERAYAGEIERFDKKIQSVTDYPKSETLRKELNLNLLSKLSDISKLSFKIDDFKYSKAPTGNPNFAYSEFNEYHTKNHKSNSSYKSYDTYMGDEKKWTKKRGKSIYEEVKSVTKNQNKTNTKLKEVLKLLFDQGTSVLSSAIFDELDLSSQKTLKKIFNIGVVETFKNGITKKVIDVLNAIPNISNARAILTSKKNLYTFSEKDFTTLKKNNDAYFKKHVNNASNAQENINRKKALSSLDEKLKTVINKTFKDFSYETQGTFQDKAYVNTLIDSYKNDLKVAQLSSSELNNLLVSTSEISNKIKLLVQTTQIEYHPFPQKGCPICTFNNIIHPISKIKI